MNDPIPTRSTAEAFKTFSSILTSSGPREALAYIVGLSDYRFIGIFRFKEGNATAALHYDRENPSRLTIEEVPAEATYCSFVRDSGSPFLTENAMEDPRLNDHVKRETMRAYCGLPMFDLNGILLGTLCHYDVVPRDPGQLDMELLLQVISALRQGNHVPPYPDKPTRHDA